MTNKIQDFSDGVPLHGSELDNIQAIAYRGSTLNTIRQLVDRNITLSARGGEWAEAYTDADGRKNSVATGETDSLFDSDKYFVGFEDTASSDTTYNPDGFGSPENAFDGDDSTYASISTKDKKSLGKTFSSKYVYACHIKMGIYGAYSTTGTVQTYDGTTWNNITGAYQLHDGSGGGLRDINLIIDDTIEGIRVEFDTGSSTVSYRFYTLEYGEQEPSEITHNLPSGSFSSTISTCYGTGLEADWEEGADIQYKLTNATEDTGWLTANQISSFTAFTSEPTKCIVKLIPKTNSPTAGFPSLNGFGLREY